MIMKRILLFIATCTINAVPHILYRQDLAF